MTVMPIIPSRKAFSSPIYLMFSGRIHSQMKDFGKHTPAEVGDKKGRSPVGVKHDFFHTPLYYKVLEKNKVLCL